MLDHHSTDRWPGPEKTLWGGFRAFFHVLSRFVGFLTPLWDKFLLRVALAQSDTFLRVCAVALTTRLVDRGLVARDASAFLHWSYIFISLYLTLTLLGVLHGIICGYIALRLEVRLKEALFTHVMRMGHGFLRSRPIGEHMFRVNSDTAAALDMVANFVPEVIERILTILMALGFLVFVSPVLGLAIAVYVCMYSVYLHVVSSYSRRLSFVARHRMQQATAVLQENLGAFVLSRVFAREGHERIRYFARLADSMRASVKFLVFGGLSGALGLVMQDWYYRATWFGLCGLMVLRGEITFGQYLALGQVILWLTLPLQQLVSAFQRMRVAAVPAERILEVLELEPPVQDAPDAVALEAVRGELAFRDVSFRYTPDGPDVLRNLSFSVAPGRKVAVVGPSGSGKTTLVSLLMRFADPSRGAVLVDGQDLRSVTLDSYRSRTGIVSQDNFIFSATVRDNILLGNTRASEKELDVVTTRAGLDQFLEDLPEGLDTYLTEGGNISGGQRQRVAIARAIIRNPRLLFLDEATSALDPDTEQQVLNHLKKAAEGATQVVVAHNLAPVQDADEILVLDGGAIVERGTHAELMVRQGVYRGMWQTHHVNHCSDEDGMNGDRS